MYSHRVALLIITSFWLFLPAVFDWWLRLDNVLMLTYACWGTAIALIALSNKRSKPR